MDEHLEIHIRMGLVSGDDEVHESLDWLLVQILAARVSFELRPMGLAGPEPVKRSLANDLRRVRLLNGHLPNDVRRHRRVLVPAGTAE